jgi:hypothetical protein
MNIKHKFHNKSDFLDQLINKSKFLAHGKIILKTDLGEAVFGHMTLNELAQGHIQWQDSSKKMMKVQVYSNNFLNILKKN